MSHSQTGTIPRGPKPSQLDIGRVGLYVFAFAAVLFFMLPAYVVISTSFKTLDEVRSGGIFALPATLYLDAWKTAWVGNCDGVACTGLQGNFWNSLAITVPSVVISVAFGALNGFALSFWRVRWARVLFGILLIGAFIPYQLFLFPLVRAVAGVGLYGSVPGTVLVHVLLSVPIMTLLFRNYYAGIPIELFNAARVDGAGFFRIFLRIVLPMSAPIIVVACILKITGVWNDFIVGLVFAGRENMPMTVALNNLVNTTDGVRAYNVDMAATVLTAALPAVVYFVSGKWFVRGVTAGAVKG